MGGLPNFPSSTCQSSAKPPYTLYPMFSLVGNGKSSAHLRSQKGQTRIRRRRSQTYGTVRRPSRIVSIQPPTHTDGIVLQTCYNSFVLDRAK